MVRHILVVRPWMCIGKNEGAGIWQAWASGGNDFGQLGLGDTTDRGTPVQISSLTSTIVHVAADNYKTILVDQDGSVRRANCISHSLIST